MPKGEKSIWPNYTIMLTSLTREFQTSLASKISHFSGTIFLLALTYNTFMAHWQRHTFSIYIYRLRFFNSRKKDNPFYIMVVLNRLREEETTLFIYLYHGCVNGLLMLYILFSSQMRIEITLKTLSHVYYIGMLTMIYNYLLYLEIMNRNQYLITAGDID